MRFVDTKIILILPNSCINLGCRVVYHKADVCWVRTLLCKRCLNCCDELPRQFGTDLTPDRILDVQVLLTL